MGIVGFLGRADILYGLIKPNKRSPTAKRRRKDGIEGTELSFLGAKLR